jgi:hypothetical protein
MKGTTMTLVEFRAWVAGARSTFLRDGPTSRANRDHSEEVRPHDPVLADLYLRAADVNEAIRRRLTEAK